MGSCCSITVWWVFSFFILVWLMGKWRKRNNKKGFYLYMFFIFSLLHLLDKGLVRGLLKLFMFSRFIYIGFVVLQLSTWSSRDGNQEEHYSVLGDWLWQDSDCHYASAQLCLSSPQAFAFHCSLLSSPSCVGLSSMPTFNFLSFLL